jgi:hypothetical protein
LIAAETAGSEREQDMAKGQMRPPKETKKPKKDAPPKQLAGSAGRAQAMKPAGASDKPK